MAKLFVLCFLVALAAVADAQRGPPRNRNTTARPSPSITQGEPAAEGEFPYQALLFSARYGDDFGFDCGGSLIADNWVVTAAHCLPDTDFTEVQMGSIDRNNMPFRVPEAQRFTHENYNSTGNLNDDIALLKLDRSATRHHRNIRVVEMASDNQGTFEGEIVTASGFGVTNDDTGDDSDVLMKVNLRVAPIQRCAETFGPGVTENQVCTIWSERIGQNHCEGDSGGPISYADSNGTKYLIGIVSYGTELCDVDRPSVATRVSKYRDWIQRIMDANP